jgi:hypothetical protein
MPGERRPQGSIRCDPGKPAGMPVGAGAAETGLIFRIVCGCVQENADAPYALRLPREPLLFSGGKRSFGSAFALYAAGLRLGAGARLLFLSSNSMTNGSAADAGGRIGRDFGQSLDAALRPANLDRELLGS